MACERWCFFDFGRDRLVYNLTIIIVLLHLAVGQSLATDSSYYHYRSLDRNDEGRTEAKLVFLEEEGVVASRERRDAQDPVTGSELNPPHFTVHTASNFTYSTDNASVTTSYSRTGAPTAPPLSDIKPSKMDPKSNNKKNKVVVSTPLNPLNSQPTIWLNQTRWPNTTNQEKSTGHNLQSKPVNEEDDIDGISISRFSDVTNVTLAANNITKTQNDTHQYYNSTFTIDEKATMKYWVNLDDHPGLKVNDLLSQSHRRAATVKLSFDFPFYGHKVRNITIATGGFLYTGDYVHSWLAATQYIAPLMANFDTRISNDSFVKYADNGTAFTVEWENVVLQDKPDAGAFTFQVTLFDSGDIVFVYKVIPLMVDLIEDTAHPVKVGLSDAYIMDRTVFFVRRKTIYEYHRVNLTRQEIKSSTVIYLKAIQTCLVMKNCSDCLTQVSAFDCKWCPDLQQCSNGVFRQRQEWLSKGCELRSVKEPKFCPASDTHPLDDHFASQDHDNMHVRARANSKHSSQSSIQDEHSADSDVKKMTVPAKVGMSGAVELLLLIVAVAGVVSWGAYAYRNPHSTSGQMLIRYRPSQWSWRRGEARYTAATIHM